MVEGTALSRQCAGGTPANTKGRLLRCSGSRVGREELLRGTLNP